MTPTEHPTASPSRATGRLAATLAATGLALAAVLSGCDDGGEGTATPASRTEPPPAAPGSVAQAATDLDVRPDAWDPGETVPGGPRIVFESEVLDFGRFREDEMREGVFRFANVGDRALVLEDPKPTCGCTATGLTKKVYQPGEQGEIGIAFDPTSPGDQTKYVVVASNGSPQPIRLEVKAEPFGILDVEPRILRLDGVRLGETHVHEVVLMPMNDSFRVTSIQLTNPQLSVVAGARREDGTIPVTVTLPADLPWGPVFTWATVNVVGQPSPDEAPITFSTRFRVQGSVYGDVVVEPAIMNTFRFGAQPGERFERSLLLARRSNRELLLEVVDHEFPNARDVEVRIEDGPAGAKKVILSATAGPATPLARGWVQVRTNVPGEEMIELPISGRIGGR